MSNPGMEIGPESRAALSSVELSSSLQTRAQVVLDELKVYQSHLQLQNKQKEVEIRVFRRGIEAELKGLEKITRRIATEKGECSAALDEERAVESPKLHALRSSNIPFYEAVWDVAKTCRGVVALSKRIYSKREDCPPQELRATGKTGNINFLDLTKLGRKGILVDVVAENGLEWIKVSTVTEKRLLFEIAKEGWEFYADYREDGEPNVSDGVSVENVATENRKLELVRIADDLKAASKGVRLQFRHPRIRFVLPRIREGIFRGVDLLIADLRATGAIVECGRVSSSNRGQLPSSCPFDFDRLLPRAATLSLTDRVNVDCTILLALISDISHLKKSQLSSATSGQTGSCHAAILRQIEAEELHPLLPNEIYPLLRGRTLECTSSAAGRMRDIVQCMGTNSERIRASIVLGSAEYQGQSGSQLREALSEQSSYPLPLEIRLPIKIVPFNSEEVLSSTVTEMLPKADRRKIFPSSVATRVTDSFHLNTINLSVFLYGWSQQIATLTSNRSVASGLLRTINGLLDQGGRDECQNADQDGMFYGPQIYICGTARSLMGKAKPCGTDSHSAEARLAQR